MPRNRRIEISGGVYHVITRGIERCVIFKDNKDRTEFEKRLSESLKETGHACYGWALMPNHFHLLIGTGEKPLSALMRKLLTGYAVYFNRRHRRSGHLYQNRYKSILCQEDAYLLELVRYIHLNPLRAKLVKDMAGLARYRWSGHTALVGHRTVAWQGVDAVLERFGSTRPEAQRRYERFVKDGQGMGKRNDLTGGGLRRSAGGWQGVYDLKRNNERWQGDERVLGDGEFVTKALNAFEERMKRKDQLKRAGWDLEKLKTEVCRIMKISEAALMRRSRLSTVSDGRAVFTWWATSELGIPRKVLADYLNISGAAITKSVKRGEAYAKEKNLKLLS
jgi:putative transposase